MPSRRIQLPKPLLKAWVWLRKKNPRSPNPQYRRNARIIHAQSGIGKRLIEEVGRELQKLDTEIGASRKARNLQEKRPEFLMRYLGAEKKLLQIAEIEKKILLAAKRAQAAIITSNWPEGIKEDYLAKIDGGIIGTLRGVTAREGLITHIKNKRAELAKANDA